MRPFHFIYRRRWGQAMLGFAATSGENGVPTRRTPFRLFILSQSALRPYELRPSRLVQNNHGSKLPLRRLASP
ncbi:MAG: hypothetical protein AAGM38_02255 [Pseudomonadota bacterium]